MKQGNHSETSVTHLYMKNLFLMAYVAFFTGCATVSVYKRESVTFTPVRILRGSEGGLYLFFDHKDDPTVIEPSSAIQRVSRTVTGIPPEEPISVRIEWTKGRPPIVHSLEIRVHTLEEIELVALRGTNTSVVTQK